MQPWSTFKLRTIELYLLSLLCWCRLESERVRWPNVLLHSTRQGLDPTRLHSLPGCFDLSWYLCWLDLFWSYKIQRSQLVFMSLSVGWLAARAVHTAAEDNRPTFEMSGTLPEGEELITHIQFYFSLTSMALFSFQNQRLRCKTPTISSRWYAIRRWVYGLLVAHNALRIKFIHI